MKVQLASRRFLAFAAKPTGLLVLFLSLLSASAAAQSDDIPSGFLGLAIGLWFLLAIAAYVYMSVCLMVIANKTGTPNGWFAWIPILNVILMLQVARKPLWWILLLLIPLLNIIIAIMIWMGIAEARNKPSWWGILMIVPIINLVVPGYLAFAD